MLPTTKARITAHGMLPTVQARTTTLLLCQAEKRVLQQLLLRFIITIKLLLQTRVHLRTEELLKERALSTTDLSQSLCSTQQMLLIHTKSEHVIIIIRAATESQTSVLCLSALLRPIRMHFVRQSTMPRISLQSTVSSRTAQAFTTIHQIQTGQSLFHFTGLQA